MLTLQAILDFLASLSDTVTADERTQALNEHIAAATADMTAEDALAALAALTVEITDATNAQLDTDRNSDQALANLMAFSEIATATTEASSFIEADVEAREARAAELAERILGPNAGGDDPEADPADPPADGDADPASAADPAAEPEAAPAEGAAQPVAAAAAVPTEPVRALRPAARRPAAQLPVVANAANQPGALPDDIGSWGLVAGANVEGLQHGSVIRTQDQLAAVFVAALQAGAGYRGPKMKTLLATIGGSPEQVGYPEERILRDGDLRGNMRKVAAVASPQAISAAGGMRSLAASGGICAPLPVTYDEPMLGSAARPVRDGMLTRFGADRGGVNLFPALHFEDMTGATGFWTNTNDITPGSDGPSIKPCLTMTCPEDEAFFIYAVTQCLEVGVFRSRYFSEQVEAWIRAAAVANARAAEIRLLTSIGTSSTDVTIGQILGTIPSVLAGLDHANSIIRSSNRLDRTLPLRWGIPSWLIDNMRTDQARRLPGTGTIDEQYALADERIMSWFRQRSIEPTLLMDGESGQMFGRQGDGPIQGYPSTAVTYLYPDGSHLFLDGGELNIGVVRDSALIETNDYRIFSETFEGHAFHGVESWRAVFDICPDGASSAAVDVDPCSTGS